MGVVPFVMMRAFPATGISFSYNIACTIFGGLTPIALTLMMKLTPMAPAYCSAAGGDWRAGRLLAAARCGQADIVKTGQHSVITSIA
ncbi:major facilitator superfamily protein [Candidatus Erwinia dacicola]|uniref:Major facilitator superfamily protein n=1 Tax=Candidatus Erwinia dacicola TaxID=252393 RepID=A0A328TV79_9GAMM|nr:major facilitator superfamily protein [Candidatus Erwinia dacicola]